MLVFNIYAVVVIGLGSLGYAATDSMVFAAIITASLDIAVRVFNRANSGERIVLINPDSGGTLVWVLPVWLLASGVALWAAGVFGPPPW